MKNYAKLIRIFRALTGKTFSNHEYKHRLILQKIAYILSIKSKSKYNYGFNWYLRGPYSPPLTRDVYNEQQPTEPSLDKDDKDDIKVVGNLTDNATNDKNLELVASVLYLMKNRGLKDFKKIYPSIHSLKPWYSEEEVKNAIKKVKKSELIS